MKREGEPSNRELRTRKDLLQAASRLVRQGRKPTMDEVAAEALVSRPTAYRYFRSVDHLLAEAAVDVTMPEPAELVRSIGSDDPAERADAVDAEVHRLMYANEAAMRVLLASSISRAADDEDLPGRQNRREPLLAEALAPLKGRISPRELIRLRRALAFLVGPESMIVASDVLRIDDHTARTVKSWAIRALVKSAMAGEK